MEGEGERENEGINTIILFVRCLVTTGVGTALLTCSEQGGGCQVEHEPCSLSCKKHN